MKALTFNLLLENGERKNHCLFNYLFSALKLNEEFCDRFEEESKAD